jgi:hypothetical protein
MSILAINQRQKCLKCEKSLHLQAKKLIRTALTSYQPKNFSPEEFNLISENFYNAFNFTVA